MRTHGDDSESAKYFPVAVILLLDSSKARFFSNRHVRLSVAQIFSLLGIRPMWQQENHRVTGVELIPLSELGRPRIDVTVRISGFFRGMSSAEKEAFVALSSSLDCVFFL